MLCKVFIDRSIDQYGEDEERAECPRQKQTGKQVSFFAYFIQSPKTCEAVDKDDRGSCARRETVGRCYNSRQGSWRNKKGESVQYIQTANDHHHHHTELQQSALTTSRIDRTNSSWQIGKPKFKRRLLNNKMLLLFHLNFDVDSIFLKLED